MATRKSLTQDEVLEGCLESKNADSKFLEDFSDDETVVKETDIDYNLIIKNSNEEELFLGSQYTEPVFVSDKNSLESRNVSKTTTSHTIEHNKTAVIKVPE